MIQLKSHLASIKMTQRELAKLAFPEMSQRNAEYHVNSICQGKEHINIKDLKAISNVLNMTIDELYSL